MKSLNVKKKKKKIQFSNLERLDEQKRLKHTYVTCVTYKKYTCIYKKFYYPIILNTISSNDRGSIVF